MGPNIQTNTQTNKWTNIANYRLNWPKRQFNENMQELCKIMQMQKKRTIKDMHMSKKYIKV